MFQFRSQHFTFNGQNKVVTGKDILYETTHDVSISITTFNFSVTSGPSKFLDFLLCLRLLLYILIHITILF